MAIKDLELNFEEQEAAVYENVLKFSEQVLRPAAVALDRVEHARDVIASDSELWNTLRHFKELGFDQLFSIEQDSDLTSTQKAKLDSIIWETLAKGDSSLATAVSFSSLPKMLLPVLSDKLTTLVTGEDELACCVMGTGCEEDNMTYASKTSDAYKITGQAKWVVNGSIATYCLLVCNILDDVGQAGSAKDKVRSQHGIFVFPLGALTESGIGSDTVASTGGLVERSEPYEKLGQRPLNHCTLNFKDFEVSNEYFLGVDEGLAEKIFCRMNSLLGLSALGLSQAALDQAKFYAHERVQGAKTIIKHQNVKDNLYKMYKKIEAARALVWRANQYVLSSDAPKFLAVLAAKDFCANVAAEVCNDALQAHGGVGLTKEYPAEKFLRDAQCLVYDIDSHFSALDAMEDK